MSDPDVERAAEFLARHAVLLLGLGILAALASLGAILVVVSAFRRYRDVLRQGFDTVVRYARTADIVDRTLVRSRALLPTGYLALHLVLGFIVTAAVSAFVVIAEDVMGGGSLAAFDVAFARALRDTVTPSWERLFATVSWLGEGEVVGVVVLAVAGYLFATGKAVMAAGWLAAQAAGGLLNLALKETFERTRPEFADPVLAAASWSFPSGHAMGTFILFGLGTYLLVRQTRSWTTAAALITASLAWCVVMAFSRLYLGVHFASDVIAGLIVGTAWVAVCVSAFEVIRRRIS